MAISVHLVDQVEARDEFPSFEPNLTRIVDRAVVELVGLRAKILKDGLSIFVQMQLVLLASVGHYAETSKAQTKSA